MALRGKDGYSLLKPVIDGGFIFSIINKTVLYGDVEG